MPETTSTTSSINLGRAITKLGLESKFLENGELQHFPVLQRVALANEIISEALKLGRWHEVVQMIWGGLGKADALYDGDKDTLRQKILESVRTTGPLPWNYQYTRTIELLAKKGEGELIFDIVTANSSNLSYQDIQEISQHFPRNYFSEGPGSQERMTLFNRVAGNKTLKEGKYNDAVHYFKALNDTEKLGAIFEELIKEERGDRFRSHNVALLEDIAETDPAQRETRIKRILQGIVGGKIVTRGFNALELAKKHRELLSEEEMDSFYTLAADNTFHHELFRTEESGYGYTERRKEIEVDPKLSLLWAKKHATSNPGESYRIFVNQGYDGEEVASSVIEGLKLGGKWEHNEDPSRLTLTHVKPEHLQLVYDRAPFEIQVGISERLADKPELARLSHVAEQRGELRTAYNLWTFVGSGFEDDYMDSLRSRMIQAEIDKTEKDGTQPSFHFLNRIDSGGHLQAFDALMNTRGRHRGKLLRAAHELAIRHTTSDRIQRVREEMMTLNPGWALRRFMDKEMGGSEMADPAGFEYALKAIAKKDGVDKEQLRSLVVKYSRDH